MDIGIESKHGKRQEPIAEKSIQSAVRVRHIINPGSLCRVLFPARFRIVELYVRL